MKKILTIIATLSFVSGCSSIRSITTPVDENLLSGSGSIIQNKKEGETNSSNFEVINLDKLLSEYGLDKPKEVAKGQTTSTEDYKYLRNDLQERIISASNQRCAAYMRIITSSKSQTQTVWTSLSLLLSGAASVVSHTSTAQALATGSTVSTGLLSTYNDAYFNNLAVNVVSAGISKKRDSILININSYKSKPLSEYSVNAAISDAIEYHATCNIISGMETAADATKSVDPEKITEPLRP